MACKQFKYYSKIGGGGGEAFLLMKLIETLYDSDYNVV